MSQFTLHIALSKQVATPEEGETLYQLVCSKLSSNPDIEIYGTIHNEYPKPRKDPDGS